MKHIDEYRDPVLARELIAAIGRTSKTPARFMEVCGTHTMAIFKFGIRDVLPEHIDLISGPGCPVCVTSTEEIDRAVKLAGMPGVIVATFGDMIRVPGSRMSLAEAQAQGGRVEVVYSTFEALELARRNPTDQVVFLGIGFETTAPTVAASAVTAKKEGLKNFSILSCHKTLPPALAALLAGDELNVNGFLMPGHVTTIIGAESYRAAAEAYKKPMVVCGFEPLDILQSIAMLIEDVEAGRYDVHIQYGRGATWEGNLPAQQVMARVFEPCDAAWRGLGVIPGSGLAFKSDFAEFDAARRFDLSVPPAKDHPGCRCGQVLRGALRPTECSLFRKVCHPQNPLGPCMVSAEGTCAAYFKYHRD